MIISKYGEFLRQEPLFGADPHHGVFGRTRTARQVSRSRWAAPGVVIGDVDEVLLAEAAYYPTGCNR